MYASVIEPNGRYNPVTELAKNAYSSIKAIKVVSSDEKYTAIKVTLKNENEKYLLISNSDNSKKTTHNLKINDKSFTWIGSYHFN